MCQWNRIAKSRRLRTGNENKPTEINASHLLLAPLSQTTEVCRRQENWQLWASGPALGRLVSGTHFLEMAWTPPLSINHSLTPVCSRNPSQVRSVRRALAPYSILDVEWTNFSPKCGVLCHIWENWEIDTFSVRFNSHNPGWGNSSLLKIFT